MVLKYTPQVLTLYGLCCGVRGHGAGAMVLKYCAHKVCFLAQKGHKALGSAGDGQMKRNGMAQMPNPLQLPIPVPVSHAVLANSQGERSHGFPVLV